MTYSLAYSKKRSFNRDMVIYGICVHDSGLHYCFNRGYLVLPVQLPQCAIQSIKQNHVYGSRERHGHGAMLQYLVKDALLRNSAQWETFMLFKDGTAPKWDKNTNCIRMFLEKRGANQGGEHG